MKVHMKFGFKDKKRILAVVLAVILMGFSLTFLIRLNFGTDPCSSMNLGISNMLGISFGNWQVIFNLILFIIVILCDRSQIGWGSLVNMFLIGYSVDFFGWILDHTLPTDFFTGLGIRIAILIPSLTLFILAAGIYMAVDLGSAPYDAVVFILASKLKKIPFRAVRMSWDITACILGYLLGSTIGLVTVVMAFSLGPVISLVKIKIDKFL